VRGWAWVLRRSLPGGLSGTGRIDLHAPDPEWDIDIINMADFPTLPPDDTTVAVEEKTSARTPPGGSFLTPKMFLGPQGIDTSRTSPQDFQCQGGVARHLLTYPIPLPVLRLQAL